MKRTMYNTPVLRPIVVALCRVCLRLSGWRLEGKPPVESKYILLALPHTSNWDFPLALMMAFVYRFDMYWMGKDSLFRGWRKPLMRWLGGLPVDRSSSNNVVAQMVEKFNASDRLVVTVSPEGTRAKVDKWKTGFYYIALGADVPIALAFLDYKRKIGGFLSTFHPTGNADEDITAIRECYRGISGKYSHQCTVE
ncbi:MAG: lysophospholipid acyltransferase family protein [Deltaproteobacteria bacterium]|nr:lysophospholipid acyltransferase family protein [Deltaproteobacteria bacterium]